MSHYLDHAATTPMRACAVEALASYSGLLNPGGQYASGREARRVLEESRERIAELLGADPIEVIFTASGTEADNLAIQGLYASSQNTRVVSSPLEHSAVRETIEHLPGAEVEFLPLDKGGHVADLRALDDPAALATSMWANNETGALQPVAEMAERAVASGTPFHIDAVQVVGKIPVDFHQLRATTLAASAHKFGGPRGVGILLARRSPAPSAVIFGGGQERGLRPGTSNVAGAAATAAALAEASVEMAAEAARLSALRDELREGILARIPRTEVHTVEPALPTHLFVSFPGAVGDSLIMLLDSAGVEASTGSACSQGVNRASRVLEAMGVSLESARGALRLTLGRTTTPEDIRAVLDVLPAVVERARVAGV